MNNKYILVRKVLDNGDKLILTLDDPHEQLREYFEWTRNLDETGTLLETPEVILLKDITDDHLEAIVLWTEDGYAEEINQVMKNEVEWRKHNG